MVSFFFFFGNHIGGGGVSYVGQDAYIYNTHACVNVYSGGDGSVYKVAPGLRDAAIFVCVCVCV